MGRGSSVLYLVHIVEQHAHIAQPSYAGIAADCGQAVFQAGEAENAFFRLIGLPVEVDLLVGAGRNAVTPAPAAILGYKHHAVLVPLVDGPGGAGSYAGGIQAVIADPGQIFHKEVMKFHGDIRAHVFEVVVLASRLAIGQIVLPVGPPFYLHALLGNQGTGAGHRLMILALGVDERFVIVSPRLVIIVHFRLVGMIEELGQPFQFGTGTQTQLAVFELPATLPFFLIFPMLGIADAGLGFYIIEVHVFRTLAVGPDILAGDGARMAANALVKIHDHRNLGFNLQANLPPPSCGPPHTYPAGCRWGHNN